MTEPRWSEIHWSFALLGLVLVAPVVHAKLASSLRGLYKHQWQVPGLALRLGAAASLALAKYVARGCRPLFSEWTLAAEITQAVMRCITTKYGDCVCVAENAEVIRKMTEVEAIKGVQETTRAYGTTIEQFQFNGLEHIWVRPASPPPKAAHRVVVLFFHGGGFLIGAPAVYIGIASELLTRIDRRLREQVGNHVHVELLLGNYRKAPQFPYPRPPQDAYAVYKYLLTDQMLQPHQVIVMGDSAGGGLTMTTLLRARDEGPTMLPLAGILLYPFVDIETKGDERKVPFCILGDIAVEGSWKAYYPHGGDSGSWGDASPVHCDLSGLPPVYIQAAELDYIRPHAERLFKKALVDGQTSWKLEIIPNVPHGFASMPSSIWPSAKVSWDALSEYAVEQFARAMKGESSLAAKAY